MATINTNLGALQAQQAMTHTERVMQDAMSQLSTGLRVSKASDDAAGLAIGSRMNAQIISLNQAIRNAYDGISMMQTADGATSTLSDMFSRMKELAVQSANGTYGSSDRTALHSEFQDLQAGVRNIIDNTTWNGVKVLNGTLSNVKYQIGSSSDDSISVNFGDLTGLKVLSSAGIATESDALTALSDTSDSLDALNAVRTTWGAAMNRLSHAADNSNNVSMNISASKSRILDTDYAHATAELARAQILQAAGTAMLSQANQQPMTVLHLLR
jgi:flagellin